MAAPAKRDSLTLPEPVPAGKAKTHVLDLEPASTAVSGQQAAASLGAVVTFGSPSAFSDSAVRVTGTPAEPRPVVDQARLAAIPGLGSLQAVADRPFQPRPRPVDSSPVRGSINLTPAGAGPGEQFQTEITASVTIGGRVFLLSSGGGSTLQITDATNPAAPRLVNRQSLGSYTSQSVAAYGNLVAVALSPADYNEATTLAAMRGLVRFFRLDAKGSLVQLMDVPVGYLPDSLAFTADGKQLVVANEGQPNWGPAGPIANGQPTYPKAYTVDPVGSIGIIDIQGSVNLRFTYTDLGLGALQLPPGIRIAGPTGTSQAQFLEPEYVTIEGSTAYVTLQESNGVAKVDLLRKEITDVFALGSVNFSTQAVDLSDRDPGGAGFKPLLGQPFQGLRMPDGIDAFRSLGKEYFITANEGDAQVYADNDNAVYLDEIRFGGSSAAARLKTIANPPVIRAGAEPSLGGPSTGKASSQAFGGRSVSVFDAVTGALVWDSGNSLQTIAVAARTYDDGRSDDKGVEPETVVVVEVDGRQLAVVGLERGLKTTLVLFDVTDPAAATYRTHIVIDGSVSPEGLTVIPAGKSSTGRALLVVSNEVSNTLNVLDLQTLVATPGIGSAGFFKPTMLKDVTGVTGGSDLAVTSLLTNGEFTVGLEPGSPVYAPTGIFDGMGAYDNGDGTYTLLVNSELGNSAGYGYLVNQEEVPGGVALSGARVHRFIVDIDSDDDASNGQQSRILSGGIAFSRVYGADGELITSAAEVNELVPTGKGFSRFCSSTYEAAQSFGPDRGFVDGIYLTGEESRDGLMWALDAESGAIWALPGLGRAGWENGTLIDTGSTETVAVLLTDDNTAPLYLWVGTKDSGAGAGFLERNGLAADQGNLYTWVPVGGSIGTDAGQAGVPDSADLLGLSLGSPAEGSWVLVGSGADVAGWSESKLRGEATAKGALQLSRLEDVHVNPENGQQAVFATTGNTAFGGADLFGNLITLDFDAAFGADGLIATGGGSTDLTVIYDGDRAVAAWEAANGAIDTDAERAAFGATIIRSPDNLTWSADGFVYVQEDRSVPASFFAKEEASIWKVNPDATDTVTGQALAERWARIDRAAVPKDYGQTDPRASGGNDPDPGNWESSGIIDVSTIYGAAPGTWFLADVQAHSLQDGNLWGGGYLVEGGQIDLIRQSQPSGV